MVDVALVKEGTLWKNHKGSEFKKSSKQRFFRSEGFHVLYSAEAGKGEKNEGDGAKERRLASASVAQVTKS